ncbi:MAG: hypothetical protein AAGN46_03505 [Acidobacteriota bacterium]
MTLLFLGQLAATLALTGLIWLVQVVQYPLFARVGADAFVAYHAGHAERITWIVGPLMLIEAAAAGFFLIGRPDWLPTWNVWAGAALVAVIWASTALLQVPQHARLADGFEASAHRLLVLGNWLRTIAWSARAALLLVALDGALRRTLDV